MRKRIPQMNALTGPEFFRLCARMGGLWTISGLRKHVGDHAKSWPDAKGFPKPAWRSGRNRLYAGWEIWVWLEDTGRVDAANRFHDLIEQLRKAKLEDVVAGHQPDGHGKPF